MTGRGTLPCVCDWRSNMFRRLGRGPSAARAARVGSRARRRAPLAVAWATAGSAPLPHTRKSAPSRLPSASDAPAIVTINSTMPHTPSADAVSVPFCGIAARFQIAFVIG